MIFSSLYTIIMHHSCDFFGLEMQVSTWSKHAMISLTYRAGRVRELSSSSCSKFKLVLALVQYSPVRDQFIQKVRSVQLGHRG